jgi:hypothetical protein
MTCVDLAKKKRKWPLCGAVLTIAGPELGCGDVDVTGDPPMRFITYVPALLVIGSLAIAGGMPRVDLDRPGALDRLKLQQPRQYQAVIAVLIASKRVPCAGNDIEVLKTRFNVRDLECGMILSTSYPALRHVSFELDGAAYVATVALEDTTTAQPAESIGLIEDSAAH